MDRFVDKNKIVFKNGEVEGFWNGRKMVDENLQTDFVNDSQIQETENEISTNEKDKLQWWCNTKDRKLKVREIIKRREDKAAENKVETKQLFTELKYQKNVQKMCESTISNDSIPIEKMSVSERSEKKSISNIIDATDSEFDEQFNNIVETDDKSVKIEILGDKFNNLLFESVEEKKNIDESDDDSFKTATSLQEDSQISENNQGSPEIINFSNKINNCDKTVDSIKNENDNLISCEKIILDEEEQNDTIREDEKTDDKAKCTLLKLWSMFRFFNTCFSAAFASDSCPTNFDNCLSVSSSILKIVSTREIASEFAEFCNIVTTTLFNFSMATVVSFIIVSS